MRAKDLRIGNYVYLYGSVAQIERVDFCREEPGIAVDKGEGIPINKEWMIKLGFIKDAELDYRWHLSEWSITYDLDDNCIRISDSWEYGKRKYVHELQNLYWCLTGEEL